MSAAVLRLVEQHRRAQARIGAAVAAESLAAWSAVRPNSLAVTGATWLATVMAVVRRERERSRDVAAAYYRLHRALATGTTVPPRHGGYAADSVSLADLRADWARISGLDDDTEGGESQTDAVQLELFDWPLPDDGAHEAAARTSLAVTGPVRAKQAADRLTADLNAGRLDGPGYVAALDDATARAGITAAGSADREVLRGGRDLLAQTTRRDRRVLGWARVPDEDPCSWCAMLASRGAVYKSRDAAVLRNSADGLPDDPEDLEKYHPMCHCQIRPVYSRTDQVSPDSERYRQEWRTVTKGLSGPAALSAWRKHISSQRR
ncbi:hypothetical protein OHV05_04310 [Kitasatospora sp. NBC_00070]|uniref:VG15 protein n=1 Tax=Kitasatospora sp. NBC_00070 TaxID=2975962 RepID=UPI003255E405